MLRAALRRRPAAHRGRLLLESDRDRIGDELGAGCRVRIDPRIERKPDLHRNRLGDEAGQRERDALTGRRHHHGAWCAAALARRRSGLRARRVRLQPQFGPATAPADAEIPARQPSRASTERERARDPQRRAYQPRATHRCRHPAAPTIRSAPLLRNSAARRGEVGNARLFDIFIFRDRPPDCLQSVEGTLLEPRLVAGAQGHVVILCGAIDVAKQPPGFGTDDP